MFSRETLPSRIRIETTSRSLNYYCGRSFINGFFFLFLLHRYIRNIIKEKENLSKGRGDVVVLSAIESSIISELAE